jgi:hypothetical protein
MALALAPDNENGQPITEWKPNRRQRAAIALLATFPFPTQAAVARQLGLNDGTVRQYSMIPAFRAAVAAAQDAALAEVKAQGKRDMEALVPKAIETKRRNLDAEDEGVSDRAATYVLDRTVFNDAGTTEDLFQIVVRRYPGTSPDDL